MADNDLIRRGDAIRAVGTFEQYTGIAEAPIEFASQYLRDIPAVDAVEVVRCKGCRYYKPFSDTGGEVGYCNGVGRPTFYGDVHADYYCADGERRTDDG